MTISVYIGNSHVNEAESSAYGSSNPVYKWFDNEEIYRYMQSLCAKVKITMSFGMIWFIARIQYFIESKGSNNIFQFNTVVFAQLRFYCSVIRGTIKYLI